MILTVVMVIQNAMKVSKLSSYPDHPVSALKKNSYSQMESLITPNVAPWFTHSF